MSHAGPMTITALVPYLVAAAGALAYVLLLPAPSRRAAFAELARLAYAVALLVVMLIVARELVHIGR
jgi:hypothetical protein